MGGLILMPVFLFIVGFLYGSVGHGGASGYIAVFSIFSIPVLQYKPLVLWMNIVVAGIAFAQYARAGHFNWRLCWPFLAGSIPFAFLGSAVAVQNKWYDVFLGAALLFPVARFAGLLPDRGGPLKPVFIPGAIFAGCVIGFVSGFLNIGGGIFLSPLLILLSWAGMKQAAAVSALFIVCNSVAGLLAASHSSVNFTTPMLTWFIAAIIGGIGGSFLGSWKFPAARIRVTLAVVLGIASIKLIFFS